MSPTTISRLQYEAKPYQDCNMNPTIPRLPYISVTIPRLPYEPYRTNMLYEPRHTKSVVRAQPYQDCHIGPAIPRLPYEPHHTKIAI